MFESLALRASVVGSWRRLRRLLHAGLPHVVAPCRTKAGSRHSGQRISALYLQDVTTFPTLSGMRIVTDSPAARALRVSGDPSAAAAGGCRQGWQRHAWR